MTNYANSLRKLTMTTAVTALLATPLAVQAQTANVGADADATADLSGAPLGATADVNGTVAAQSDLTDPVADTTANIDTDIDTEAEVAETLPVEAEADVDIALDGSTVAVGSDDTVLGTISGAEPQPDGSVRYAIDLAEGLVADSDRAVVQIEQEVDAEGQLVIGMTGEEFAAALTQQIDAGNTVKTQTN